MRRPLVLLSNDDGYQTPGIRGVREALLDFADVIVCAPKDEQSAASHALTLSRPLRLTHHGDGIHSVDGTPADCVYVALHSGTKVVPRRPDLVVSGLNYGVNLGGDVFYSGTVAAAREGALKGIPALAVSADVEADIDRAAAVSAHIARALTDEGPAAEKPDDDRIGGVLLNVNFPRGRAWPIQATRLGTRHYTEGIEFRRDPRGREYLWIGGAGVEHGEVTGSDTEAFDAGAVGVTPLALDLWARGHTELSERLVGRLGSSDS